MRHAAVQGAQGCAARRLRERDKRERVLGAVGRWVAGPSEGISNQLRSAGAALQQLLPLAVGV